MKKAMLIALCVGLGLIMIGAVVFTTAFAASGFDTTIFETVKTVEETFPVTEAFDSVAVNVRTGVRFELSNDGSCRAEYKGGDFGKRSVSVLNGVLSVEETDVSVFANLYFHKSEYVVYLPASSYKDLTVNASTGIVTVPETLSFERARISSATGSVRFFASVSGELKISCSTGLATVRGVTAEDLTVEQHTGGVTLQNVRVSNGITVKASTGGIYAEDVTAKTVTVTVSTGGASLADVVASDTLSVTSKTGSISLLRCDAPDVILKASTGSIRGSLRTGKIFEAHSRTGSVRVPSSTADGGKCTAETSTGSIRLTVEN